MLGFSSRALCPNDLLSLKYVHDARLSPDGRLIACVTSRTLEEPAEEIFEITIEDLATGSKREVSFAGRAQYPRWSPDGTRLSFVGLRDDTQRLYITTLTGQGCVALTPEGMRVSGPACWSPDGSTLAFTVMTYRMSVGLRRISKRVFRSEGLGIVDDVLMSIHVVNVRSGIIRSVDTGCAIAMQPQFSPCGARILFLGAETATGYASFGGLNLYTVDLGDASVVEVLGEGWFVAAAAWSPCGKRVVVAGDYDSQLTVPTAGLWVVDRDGSNPRCRTEEFIGNVGLRVHHDMPTWDTSQNNIFTVPNSTHAYATVETRGCAEIWRIALDGRPECEPVVSGPRSCVVLDAGSRAERLLYAATDLRSPWELYISEMKGTQERQLTRLNQDALAEWPSLKVEHLRFESADGLPLEGWFLARADRTGPQPTVMFIHGGPFLATGHAFRFDFHLLAANGYAVLFANFRGSAGYGESFVYGIMHDWGARGFPDHMAAVDAAVSCGLADPARLGVWGPSHGGFATAWVVGHTTRFRAAVAESAVINFSTLYYLCDAPDLFSRALGGRPDEIPDIYRSRSPLTYAGRCRTPTLLLHGEEDLRCPIAEAEQFYRALHDVGCKTELVLIPGMSHMGDSTGPLPARVGQNEALLEWFERHL